MARSIVDAFDGPAATAGVKVVQVCGFEALPPDLAILLAAETARERWDETLAQVESVVTVKPLPGMPRPSDMLSGGTMQSMAEVVRDFMTFVRGTGPSEVESGIVATCLAGLDAAEEAAA